MSSVPQMPWGKYRDVPFTEIPSSYLAWVLDTCDHVRPTLAAAITTELRSRFGSPPPPPPSSASWHRPCPDPGLAAAIVSAGLHVLARKHHPDVGGDLRMMQRLNAVADWLNSVVPQ